MKIIVIGLGSMGKRRIRLMKMHYPEYELCAVDSQLSRREECEEKYGVQTYSDLNSAITEFAPQAAFVCTSPLAHSKLISACLDINLHVFTEINLVPDGYEKNIRLAEEKNLTLFLSSTPLYRKEPQYIIRQASSSKQKLSYTYHVGQYLPDWHPWESYKDFFLNDKRTNGCREILAINLPWVTAAFGPIQSLNVQKTRLTELDIDYPDCYALTLMHENGNLGSISVELAAREAVHSMRVTGEKLLLEWNGTPDSLRQFDIAAKKWNTVDCYEQVDTQAGYSHNIIEDAYAAEISSFFAAINNGKKPQYGFSEDLKLLDWIEKIEYA